MYGCSESLGLVWEVDRKGHS